MLPSDQDTAVAAWLDLPGTHREIEVARKRLLRLGSNADPVMFALGIELLAALNVYGGDPGPDPLDDEDDDLDPEPDEPWRPRVA